MERMYLSKSQAQTKKLGEVLAKKVLKKELSSVFGLTGELGEGKTTFLQGFARGLGVKEKILSPTFVIIKRFQLNNIKNFKNFYHIDCYRVENPREVLKLDFRKIVSNPKNIIAIEWADKIDKILPERTAWLKFQFLNPKERKIMIKWKNV